MSGDPLDEIGPALSALRRRTRAARGPSPQRNGLLNLLMERPGLTVGELAAEMDVAQPVASRAVAAAVSDGQVRRVASQEDGRKVTLELTVAGRRLWRTLAAQQRVAFESITEHWSEADCTMLAGLLVRYARDSVEWAAGRSPS